MCEEERAQPATATGEVRRGLRCRICTGCGLCPGVTPEGAAAGELHVLTEGAFLRGQFSQRHFSPPSGQAVSKERLPLPQPGEKSEEPFPGRQEDAASGQRLAVADIGTTTIAMLLLGPDGSLSDKYVTVNPQVAYGADVISRIRAAEDGEKAAEMRKTVCEALERGLAEFRGRLTGQESLRLILAANTTMAYLLMGWDTAELGRAPFCASRLDCAETEIAGVPCFVFPGMSAFVGGDITAGIYACGMAEAEEIQLFIDLGTNGELALGNRERRIACATAAGPAFEGGAGRGVWGADMVSLLAALRRENLLDETGLLAEEYFETGVRAGNVLVTQEAVRGIQLAKAAVASGIEVLLEKYGIDMRQVDRVVLAGGFGYFLNPADAAEIGLLPPKLAEKAFAGGNTALAGAVRAGGLLLQEHGAEKLRRQLEDIASGTQCVNLGGESAFGERYMEHLNLCRIGEP